MKHGFFTRQNGPLFVYLLFPELSEHSKLIKTHIIISLLHDFLISISLLHDFLISLTWPTLFLITLIVKNMQIPCYIV